MTFAPPPVDSPLPPPVPPARPQLRRSSTEKLLGGVCGGLAEYSGVDALLWRIGFVALTLAGGSGVLIYLLLWILMPMGPVGPDHRMNALDGLIDRLHEALSGLGQRRP